MADLKPAAAIEAGALALARRTERRNHHHKCPVYGTAATERCSCYVLRKARDRATTAINAALPHLTKGQP